MLYNTFQSATPLRSAHSHVGILHPHLVFHGHTGVDIPDCISVGSVVFAELTAEYPLLYSVC